MSDQGVREIQLNGKQLVFMFMTTTVAAVVIFLCGVMVGRGVSTTRPANVVAAAEATVDPTADIPGAPASTTDGTAPGAPASPQETLKELSYAGRLEGREPPPEPAVEPIAAPVPAMADVKADSAPVAPPAARAKDSIGGEPKGDGFVVQVASLRSRGEADAIAQRLSSKGFPSFVTTPGSGGPPVFRVRVGKYADRGEAENIARRLEREEQFKPWITR